MDRLNKSFEEALKGLESSEMEVRYRATILLGEIADPRAIEPLVGRFGDEEHDVGLEAGFALRKLGEPALPSILKAVFDANATTRHYALMALRYFDGPEVREAILKSLSVENKGALMAAARAAGRPSFVEAVPGLTRLVEAQIEDSWDAQLMREEAATSLGIIGDPNAVDALSLVLTDKDEAVATEAAVALGKIGGARAIPLLIEALRAVETKGVRYSIVGALDQFGHAAKPAILTALNDRNPNIRFGAAMVLGLIGDTADLSRLEVMAETDTGESFSHEKVTTAARKAIKKIKEKYERAG